MTAIEYLDSLIGKPIDLEQTTCLVPDIWEGATLLGHDPRTIFVDFGGPILLNRKHVLWIAPAQLETDEALHEVKVTQLEVA